MLLLTCNLNAAWNESGSRWDCCAIGPSDSLTFGFRDSCSSGPLELPRLQIATIPRFCLLANFSRKIQVLRLRSFGITRLKSASKRLDVVNLLSRKE